MLNIVVIHYSGFTAIDFFAVVRRHTGHHIRTHPYKSHTPTSSGDSAIPKVYSDGCCYGNGKKHSRAGVGVYWGEGHTQ